MRSEYKILLLAGLITNFGGNLIGPFYAVFVQKIGGSILDIGYTTTIFSIASGILMILMGKISDKLNKEKYKKKIIDFIAINEIKKDEEITVNYSQGNQKDKSPLWFYLNP